MIRIGVVAALEAEARALAKLPSEFVVTVSGAGRERAYLAAKRLVENGASAIVSWGSAAALDATLAPGALVVPCAIVDAARTTHAVDAQWQRAVAGMLAPAVRVSAGALAEAAQTLASADDKTALRSRTRAVGADMESAGISTAARELGVPFIAIRAIADTVDVAVPPRLAAALQPNGEIDVVSGAARLLVSPWDWPAAVRLGLAFRSALLALRVAAPALYASALSASENTSRRRDACIVRV